MIGSLIATAKSFIGYKEKSSNVQLEDFSNNNGYSNYTKFNADYNKYIGKISLREEWCWTFIVMCFYYTFGYDKTKQYLNNNFNIYEGLINNLAYNIPAKNNVPQIGDIAVFFDITKQKGGHIGLIIDVTSSKFYTVEGNIAQKDNGGAVVERSYSLTYPYVFSYSRPLYNKIRLGDRILFKGSKGADVTELQEILIKCGYPCGKIDGLFGTKTENAIKKYQAASSLPADGIVTKAIALKIGKIGAIDTTLNVEDKNSIITRILKYGAIGYDVEWLQTRLKELGYACGKIDGFFGNKTLEAVKSFQYRSNLTVDGIVGEKTVIALNGVWDLR